MLRLGLTSLILAFALAQQTDTSDQKMKGDYDFYVNKVFANAMSYGLEVYDSGSVSASASKAAELVASIEEKATFQTQLSLNSASFKAITSESEMKSGRDYLFLTSLLRVDKISKSSIYHVEYRCWVFDQVRVIRNGWVGSVALISRVESKFVQKEDVPSAINSLVTDTVKDVAMTCLKANRAR